MNTQALPCSKCGSMNTELRDSPPGGGILSGVKEFLLSAARVPGHVLPGGRKFVVCKDCGHVSCVHIR